jgi:hypothetical protein
MRALSSTLSSNHIAPIHLTNHCVKDYSLCDLIDHSLPRMSTDTLLHSRSLEGQSTDKNGPSGTITQVELSHPGVDLPTDHKPTDPDHQVTNERPPS